MEMKTQMHTIFLMVGPSHCGKSFLANQLKSQLNKKLPNSCEILSSDETRRWLLGESLDKYDPRMLQVSSQAFSVLENNLVNLISYPVSKPFVIIDSTGLNKEFRDRMASIASEYHYNIEMILFNYKKRDDFFSFNPASASIVNNHIKKLHKDVLPNLGRKHFSKINKILTPQGDVSIEIPNLEEYQRCVFPEKNYHIIGDIHGCYNELISLLEKKKIFSNDSFSIDPDLEQVILVGDLIDKGPKSSEVLKFVLKNKEFIKVVIGNHENFVEKFLSKKINNKFEPGFLEDNFSCSIDFTSEDHKNLQEIIKESYPFIKTNKLIVTHAPCKNKYLGKIDSKSKQNQRNFFWKKRSRDFKSLEEYTAYKNEAMSFIENESNFIHPYHIFGHVAMKNVLSLKNKVCLDTGAVHGNKLTAMTLSYKPFYESIQASTAYYPKELEVLFKKEKKIIIEDLDPKEFGRIQHSASDKINYVSGTVSPSASSIETMELENLDTAFSYYKNKGLKKLMIQNKYMGSRCNVYLFKDLEKCFSTSRNGFKIKHLDLTEVYSNLIKRLHSEFKNNKTKMLLIDGELMPWAALGKGLIENEFQSTGFALKSETSLLKKTGFEEQLQPHLDYFQANKDVLIKDLSSLPGKALDKKYGTQKYQMIKALRYLNWINLEEQEDMIKTYNEQVEIFGGEQDLHFKPFSILKQVFNDDSEKVWINEDQDTEEMFTKISDDSYFVVDLEDPKSVEMAQDFYNKSTIENNEEGVVIKPLKTFSPSIAPFLKVRNPRYLSIIYGYDYTHERKLKNLIKKKRIKNKLSLSIKEYALGKKLLEIPMKDISMENTSYTQTLASLILEEKKEQNLDPRL